MHLLLIVVNFNKDLWDGKKFSHIFYFMIFFFERNHKNEYLEK